VRVMKRYTFAGELVLDGALHIGSGGGGTLANADAPTDATIVRDGSGRAYIPGSSFRGVLRGAIGEYAPRLSMGEIRDDSQIEASVKRALQISAQGNPGSLKEADIQKKLNQTSVLEPAERLFGTVFWASPLIIPDLYLKSNPGGEGEVRHGIAIDKDTGATLDSAKFDYEVMPRDAIFEFRARLDVSDVSSSQENEWLDLLALGLRLFELGEIRLGGRLARGIGQVHLQSLSVSLLDTSDKGKLLRFLKSNRAALYSGDVVATNWTTTRLAGVA